MHTICEVYFTTLIFFYLDIIFKQDTTIIIAAKKIESEMD